MSVFFNKNFAPVLSFYSLLVFRYFSLFCLTHNFSVQTFAHWDCVSPPSSCQSTLLLLITKKTNKNLPRPSLYPAHLWVKLMKVLQYSDFLVCSICACVSMLYWLLLLPCSNLILLMLLQITSNRQMHVDLYIEEANWLPVTFLQITRAGRGGRTGLRWKAAATQRWEKPLAISWPELRPRSPSTAGWTGPPNTEEIGSPEK